MKRIIFIVLVILIAACRPRENKQSDDTGTAADSIANELISCAFRCRGYLYLPPDRLATVAAPIGGFISSIFYNTGDYVKKGTLLAVLRHYDYIEIQKDYLEAKSLLSYYSEDFKRQGGLTLDQATSIKKMQRAQADYQAVEAKLKALAAQLKFIGIDPERVEHKGFTSSINIYAPVNGYITRVEGNKGKFLDPYGFIYEIADIDDLHLNFELPDSLFNKVSKDMDILFAVAGAKNKYLSARISNISQVINTETNCFSVFARPDSSNCSFRPGMAVEVKLVLKY